MVTPDFGSWLEFGMDQGWCGPVYCQNHEDPKEYIKKAEEDADMDFCWAVVHIHEGVNG